MDLIVPEISCVYVEFMRIHHDVAAAAARSSPTQVLGSWAAVQSNRAFGPPKRRRQGPRRGFTYVHFKLTNSETWKFYRYDQNPKPTHICMPVNQRPGQHNCLSKG